MIIIDYTIYGFIITNKFIYRISRKINQWSRTKYKVDIEGIIDAISSKGIKMIKPIPIDGLEFSGEDWHISKNLTDNEILIPARNSIYKDIKGNYSIRFEDYQNTYQDDEDTDTSSMAAEINHE